MALSHSIASTLRRLVPGFVKRPLRPYLIQLSIAADFLKDASRYYRFSGTTTSPTNRDASRAEITKYYHILEKGLCLSSPRPWFGLEIVDALTTILQSYLSQYGPDSTTRTAIGALAAYLGYCRAFPTPSPFDQSRIANIEALCRQHPDSIDSGGFYIIEAASIRRHATDTFDHLSGSRHSIRHFSEEPVDAALLEEALRMAQRTPSVCNRQAWKVHMYRDPIQKRAILDCQNGNRGFGDQIDTLLLVTCSLRCFFGKSERMQPYIDGGLYAMSLMYALHFLGLGTCALNLSLEHDGERSLRIASGVPEDELFIFIIAVGHLPPTLRVAYSQRRELNDVLILH